MAQAESGAAQWAMRLAAVGAGLFIVGPLLAHFWVVPSLTGFVLFDLGGLLGLVALGLGVTAALRGHGAGAGLALGGLMTVVFLGLASGGAKVPRINDITTDTVNPPRFVKAGDLPGNRGRDLTYPGGSFAEQQRAGYPDLAPLQLALPVDEAFPRVEAAARSLPNAEIIRVDPAAHVIEGVCTSRLFRFQDDFVVEVRPQDGGSVVQMRSKSRDGKGDLGVNAARIKALFAKLS